MKEFSIIGEIDIPFVAAEEYAEIATAWLEGGTTFLVNKEGEEILTGNRPLSWGVTDEEGQTRLGPPRSAWGSLVLTRPPLKTPESLLFSKKSIKRLHQVAPVMSTASLRLGVLDEEGYFNRTICTLDVDRIGGDPPETLYHSDEYLRGYSWLTIIPGVLAERLGGAAFLRSTAAFASVEELPDGSLWLLATPEWDQYGSEQIDAVFDALALVLPAGMSEDYPIPLPWPPLLVSWRDASSNRRPS